MDIQTALTGASIGTAALASLYGIALHLRDMWEARR